MLNELINQPFSGFDSRSLKFLKSISNPKNNNKVWFEKNRVMYETYLKQPMYDLVDTLAIEINKIDPDIVVNYKSIFRINRDIRFSKDKTPYKTYYSAAFAFGRVKKAEIPHFYFQFNSKEFLFAGGQYSTDIENLKKIRKAVYTNFKDYKSIITNKTFVKTYGAVQGESLTRLPKGYDKLNSDTMDSLLIRNLKLKQYYVYSTYKAEVILDDQLTNIILESIRKTYYFVKFLSEAIV